MLERCPNGRIYSPSCIRHIQLSIVLISVFYIIAVSRLPYFCLFSFFLKIFCSLRLLYTFMFPFSHRRGTTSTHFLRCPRETLLTCLLVPTLLVSSSFRMTPRLILPVAHWVPLVVSIINFFSLYLFCPDFFFNCHSLCCAEENLYLAGAKGTTVSTEVK